MNINTVRSVMQAPHESFMKSATSPFPTDSFLSDSVHVFYRLPGECEAVEFYHPSRALLNGFNLLGVSYSSAKSFLKDLDPNVEEDSAGLTSFLLGVGIYAPSHLLNPAMETESVIAFEQGYYDM